MISRIKINTFLIYMFSFLGLFCFPASNIAQVQTISLIDSYFVQGPLVTSTTNKPEGKNSNDLFIEAELTEENYMSYLQFDLSTIPDNVTIESCSLRLVCSIDPSKNGSIRVFNVLNNQMPSTDISNKQMASVPYADGDFEKNDEILFSGEIDDALQAALDKASDKFTVLLKTTSRDAYAGFYSKNLSAYDPTDQNPALRPRLIIEYSPKPSQMAWSGFRADAQHTSRMSWGFGGAKMKLDESQHIGKVNQFGGTIQQNMLLYKDNIYVASSNSSSAYSIYVVDPFAKSTSALTTTEPLNSPTQMPAIDPFGRLYYVSGNAVDCIDLENDNAITHPIPIADIDKVKASPTIGPDGSLYLASQLYVTAYAPFPNNDLLWQYKSEKNVSSVALSGDGTMAYVLFDDPDGNGGDGLAIINTTDGTGSKINLNNTPDSKDNPSTPVLDNNSNAFITNGNPYGNILYVVEANDNTHTPKVLASGSNISQPIIDGEGNVIYVNDGKLYKYDNRAILLNGSVSLGSISSMVTDGANNVYCWNKNEHLLYAFNSDGKLLFQSKCSQYNFAFDLMMARDGSVYNASDKAIYFIRPMNFNSLSSSENLIEQLDKNNTTFRAQNMKLSESYKFESGDVQTLLGADEVVIGFDINSPTIELAPGSDIQLISGGEIRIVKGTTFRVKKGAKLSCKKGY